MVTKKIKMVVFDLVITDNSNKCRIEKDLSIIGDSKKMAYDEENIKCHLNDGENGFPVNIRIEIKTFGCSDDTFMEVSEEVCTKRK